MVHHELIFLGTLMMMHEHIRILDMLVRILMRAPHIEQFARQIFNQLHVVMMPGNIRLLHTAHGVRKERLQVSVVLFRLKGITCSHRLRD